MGGAHEGFTIDFKAGVWSDMEVAIFSYVHSYGAVVFLLFFFLIQTSSFTGGWVIVF